MLDNASIHKRQEFVDARGGIVEWLPPYCWHLNPIEEGFGCIRQWLMQNKHLYGQVPGGTRGLLQLAFEHAVGRRRARAAASRTHIIVEHDAREALCENGM